MKKLIEPIISILMLLFAIGFNLNLYKLEPTAKIDPNDNAFQYGVIDRTNTVWDWATKECPKNIFFPICHLGYLVDHWVPNWNSGYNLPHYYSHVPQILIVGSWRVLQACASLIGFHFMDLFSYYHLVIYLLLCFFPLTMFLSLRLIRVRYIVAGVGALLASHISTDGLYGFDPPSYLWRGWGLSSQLFAQVWIPLAIASSYRYLTLPILTRHANIVASEALLSWDGVIKILHTTLSRKKQHHNESTGEIQALYDEYSTSYWLSVLIITVSLTMHIGLGIITLLTIGVLALTLPLLTLLMQKSLREVCNHLVVVLTRLILLVSMPLAILAYWFVPVLILDNYHNLSFWDPPWKFDSFGWKEMWIRVLNGAIFDFGRIPLFTSLVLAGWLVSLIHKYEPFIMQKNASLPDTKTDSTVTTVNPVLYPLFPFAVLFVFWFLLSFGKTTWGEILNLIPGMKGFHMHRFLIGMHFIGLFLAPIGFWYVMELLSDALFAIVKRYAPDLNQRLFINFIALPIFGAFAVFIVGKPIYDQTIYYNQLNDRLIIQANENYTASKKNYDELIAKLHALPSARVFAGRGGGWGKDFKIAGVTYFMQLSTFGFPINFWMPQTWSPNADSEQYFTDTKPVDYDLYNLRYVTAPPNVEPQPFWKEIASNPDWKIYEVPTSGYFTTGSKAAVVSIAKRKFINVVRLWIQSDYYKNKIFPELTFNKLGYNPEALPTFGMIDEATYQTLDGKTYPLFKNIPVYQVNPLPETEPKLSLEKVDTDMRYETTVTLDKTCTRCLVVLKETYHPNWKATVDGVSVKPINVMPFFAAVPVTKTGTYKVVFSYQPSPLKITLLSLSILGVFILLLLWIYSLKEKLQRIRTIIW